MAVLGGPAIPGSLRQINRLTVLRALRDLGPTTKPILATHTGISRPTTSKVVDELEADGLAERVGLAPSGAIGGKPGALFRFNARGVYSGAVFLRVDTVQAGVIDGNAKVRAQVEYPLGGDRRPEPVIDRIVSALGEALARLGLTSRELLGIGVGVPGITSYHTGIVHFAPHLPAWAEVPLGPILARRLDASVWVDNDSHVQALAERHFGQGQEVGNFASVQSGIGLSAAFYFDGALYRGHTDTAGEIGHMTVVEDGLPCACGNWGCWETVASTTRLFHEAHATAGADLRAWLADAAKDAGDLAEGEADPACVTAGAQAIFRAARQGEPEAARLVVEHARHFSNGIVTLVNVLNPQRIIIWGDSVAAGAPFLDTVRDEVKRQAFGRSGDTCEIVFSELAEDVGLIGAGALAFDALFDGVQ
jgi:predicted NBD/HSP70 family sugar kinase